jgi:hypothetical protein
MTQPPRIFQPYRGLQSPYVRNGELVDTGRPDSDNAEPLSDDEIAERLAQSAAQPVDWRDVRGRIPSYSEYPMSRRIIPITHGVDNNEHLLGFACRSIVVQTLQTTGYLYIPEVQMFVPPGTAMAHINIPERIEKVSFQWYTAPTTPGGVTPVAGAYAIAWLYDEWTPPSIMAGILGTVAISGTVQAAIVESVVLHTIIDSATLGTVTIAGTVTANPVVITTPTLTNVAQNAANVTLLATNAARIGAVIVNDSAANLFVKFGATASATSYTYLLPPLATLVLPDGPLYRGQIDGIWSGAGAGAARITESV